MLHAILRTLAAWPNQSTNARQDVESSCPKSCPNSIPSNASNLIILLSQVFDIEQGWFFVLTCNPIDVNPISSSKKEKTEVAPLTPMVNQLTCIKF